MGVATRDESTAIAQRLAAVAELFVRRSGALAECEWWCADGCDAVAAEVSAAQHISHARAAGQVQFACALWHRLPAVADVFAFGVIDFRMVSTIISRTENVDEDVMPQLDEAIARHAEKWMKSPASGRCPSRPRSCGIEGTGDHPGYLCGFGILPAESVRELAATATLKPLTVPSGQREPGYRPSAGLAEFIRWRDLTCRWPGCNRPVEKSDIDHTVPWPYGPTHPSNNKP